MRHNTPVTTMAAALALALALLVGVLLPSDSVVHAADPVFDSGTNARSVAENTPPGVNIGAPISATDTDETALEYGNTLTYSLGGTDAASFDIDAATGQLITKAPLDEETKSSYEVEVTVDDGETRETPLTPQTVAITVTDVDEEPAAPLPPTVVSGAGADSTTSLKVVWHAPENTGPTTITYAVEYKKTTDLSFTSDGVTPSGTSATISPTPALDPGTSYHVRVQATTDEGTGPWSLVGTGSTNKAGNSPPTFGATGAVTRNVFENTSAGEDVGAPVRADDNDATKLTYQLDGPDAALFAFVTSSGQIRTKAPLNHEDVECGYDTADDPTSCTFRVTVAVSDGAGGSDATVVNIMVNNRHEPLLAPGRPTVRGTENLSTSLDVSWNEPENTGPPIAGYDVRYREGSSGEFSNDNCSSVNTDNCDNITTGTKTTIVGLTAGKSHQVQVLTIIAGGSKSVWSDIGTGSTNPANKEPRFDDRPSSGDGSTRLSAYTISRNVDENTPSGRSVGSVVRAEDGDGHTRTYKLVAAPSPNADDVDKFDINKSTGQILTKEPLDHEDTGCGYLATDDTLASTTATTCTYTVVVEVRDGLDTHKVKEEDENPVADDTITVTINVRDRDEVPTVPTVTVTSPSDQTTLNVIWDAPENRGPTPITYDVQYRKGSAAFSDDNCDSIDTDNCSGISGGTTTTIMGLDANTEYRVQVRAKNIEGTSAWSPLVAVKTNKEGNGPPAFTGAASTLTVAENGPAGELIGTVTASDGDSDMWTYRLDGVDRTSFTLNTSNGEIKTKSSLNFEEKASYSVRVRANDGTDGGSSYHNVTINVTNVNEPPNPPVAPRVVPTKDSGRSLDVTWNEPPQNAGKPPITDYDIRYRKLGTDEAAWQNWPHGPDSAQDDTGDTDRSTKINRVAEATEAAPLESLTQYEVQVKAFNAEGISDWSGIGTGRTGAGNRRPSFDRTESVVTLRVDENTRSGQPVGSAVSATDADGNRLTYTLDGPNKDLFTIVSSGSQGGQIRTRADLDHETRGSYALTVKVDDGSRRDNSGAAKSVTVEVDDVDEIPPAPAAPRVAGIAGSTDSVRVTWDAPTYTGPSITDYEVRYGEAGSGGWTTLVGRTGADRSQIITELTAGQRYEVQVRAKSDEGTGPWSRSGTGMPNPDVANRVPAFSGGARTFSVAENTAPSTDVGSLIAALDPDGDVLTYTLEGVDANSFDILSTSDGGQIQTSAELDFEEKSSYSVAVRVRDDRGGTDAVNVTIRVTDVDGEAPATPLTPTVTAVSSTSLQVSWEEPDNTGPPINDYDYRYRSSTESWTEVTNTTITDTTVTIEQLTAGTSYDVAVRAKNAEGASEWSNPGIGSTNAPGANNPPVFTEGTSATRSVSATSPAGTNIGEPVAATDADAGDTLTYSLEGRDAPSFDINTSTGQLLTKSGITLIVGTTYTVTVAVDDGDDGIDVARIAVSIEATAAPPNNEPVFTEGTSTTRSVSSSAPAGTSIGTPVTATDADAGDTITYTLEGTDAASFAINSTNGQLLTRSGVTLSGTTYSVTVKATDNNGGSATIAVTITVILNRAPVFSEGVTATRSVREDAAPGTAIGNPITATDPDPGTTLTYRREGADASSFGIVTATGQLLASAALDASTKAAYVFDVVVSDGSAEARITVIITVTPLPASFNCATNGAVSDASNTGLVSDCEALMRAKNNLEGNTGSLNWSPSTPINQWDGVLLRGTPARVTFLTLAGEGLDGRVPADLGRLSMLRWLNLRSNSLSGSIPSELNSLTRLERLLLHNNRLSGPIPNLSGLSNLKMLWLSGRDMSLSGNLPSWLNSMSSLESLSLWGNELSGPIPRLTGMTSLSLLKLQSNNLSGGVPAWFGDMDGPAILYLHDNELTGAIPANLGRNTGVVRLWLDRNNLSGTIPPALSGMTSLRTLNLRDNQLTGSIPPQLGTLSRLQQLRLHNNQLTGIIPAELGHLSELRQLAVSNNQLTGTIPSALGDLDKLGLLWLSDNQLTGTIPSELGDLGDTLGNIRLAGNNFDAAACVPSGLANVAENDYSEAGLSICP